MSDANRLNVTAGLASMGVALTLVLLKLWAFAETGSLAVAASLADSALDLIVSLGGFAAILYSARPADEDHSFGHSSAEDLTALAQSAFILVSAAAIAWRAGLRLFSPGQEVELGAQAQGMLVMGLSVVLTLGLVAWQRHVAARTGSKVVAADSLHYVGDLIPNIGAIASLWISARFGLDQVDSIVAIVAAALMTVGAVRIGRDAWDALMDRQASPAILDGIRAIAANYPGVHGFHDLQTRTAGSRIFVNMHVELDGEQTLSEAHDIGAGLRREIMKAFPQAEVIIHKDPVGNPEED